MAKFYFEGQALTFYQNLLASQSPNLSIVQGVLADYVLGRLPVACVETLADDTLTLLYYALRVNNDPAKQVVADSLAFAMTAKPTPHPVHLIRPNIRVSPSSPLIAALPFVRKRIVRVRVLCRDETAAGGGLWVIAMDLP